MIKKFKFFEKNIACHYVFVDYTIHNNTKTNTRLKFSTDDYAPEFLNLKVFEGTFIEFREMVLNHPDMCWYSNYKKPLIHAIRFYSANRKNYQIYGDHQYFRYDRRRIKKNQQLTIVYEIV